MAAPLRVAVVGVGSMGSLHARVINGHDRTTLAAVVDPNEEIGRAAADKYGATWAADLDGIPGVDAVVVAAATQFHHDIGTEVLDRGLPLLMEKPLADSLAHSEDLVRRSEKSDVPLMCGLLERYNPGIVTALSVLEQPLHITAQRHSPYVARIRTGVASDLLIHDVDIVIRMMGSEPTKVEGSMGYLHPESATGSEDVAEAMLTFEGGAVGNISASRMSQRKVRGFVVNELERLIEIDMLRNAVTIYRHVLGENTEDGLSYKQQTIIEIPQLVTNREPLAAQLDRFVALAAGEADASEERATILPAHRVIEVVRDRARA
jgi:predicted dehydrogenase